MPSPESIRPGLAADLADASAIYDEQVRTGHATFDVEPAPASTWRKLLGRTEPGDHFLVADDDGDVVGFAYSSAYRPRPAYRFTRESTVYLAERARGRGLGRVLYDELLDRVRADGIHVVLAVVALPNPASVALHEACGFEHAGTLREAGRKFDRWIDTAFYQLLL
ncbi:MAG TPA: GNAT family N-acetyltransferase [Nocardioides sp.]|uniref:GNAT family N-acetyltransferase n=1 Tax=Nocardioides sp. TaxID=35761 RepID=UPI002E350026|nr:N-acetyltransferase family protein [Nocardioides sp.]HEX3932024.1 GNAT family N-acetyltransferase [Nocardioides sp.]